MQRAFGVQEILKVNAHDWATRAEKEICIAMALARPDWPIYIISIIGDYTPDYKMDLHRRFLNFLFNGDVMKKFIILFELTPIERRDGLILCKSNKLKYKYMLRGSMCKILPKYMLMDKWEAEWTIASVAHDHTIKFITFFPGAEWTDGEIEPPYLEIECKKYPLGRHRQRVRIARRKLKNLLNAIWGLGVDSFFVFVSVALYLEPIARVIRRNEKFFLNFIFAVSFFVFGFAQRIHLCMLSAAGLLVPMGVKEEAYLIFACCLFVDRVLYAFGFA